MHPAHVSQKNISSCPWGEITLFGPKILPVSAFLLGTWWCNSKTCWLTHIISWILKVLNGIFACGYYCWLSLVVFCTFFFFCHNCEQCILYIILFRPTSIHHSHKTIAYFLDPWMGRKYHYFRLDALFAGKLCFHHVHPPKVQWDEPTAWLIFSALSLHYCSQCSHGEEQSQETLSHNRRPRPHPIFSLQ